MSSEATAAAFEARARLFETAGRRFVDDRKSVAASLREAAIETGCLPEVFHAVAERIEQGTSVKQAFLEFPGTFDLAEAELARLLDTRYKETFFPHAADYSVARAHLARSRHASDPVTRFVVAFAHLIRCGVPLMDALSVAGGMSPLPALRGEAARLVEQMHESAYRESPTLLSASPLFALPGGATAVVQGFAWGVLDVTCLALVRQQIGPDPSEIPSPDEVGRHAEILARKGVPLDEAGVRFMSRIERKTLRYLTEVAERDEPTRKSA